ncbi:MAG: hypothetical protein V1888_00130 [archaeon]
MKNYAAFGRAFLMDVFGKYYKEKLCFVLMLPQNHFLFGLIASIVLYFEFNVSLIGCFIFLVASVVIDVDHYLYYVYRKRDWSLRKAVSWFMGKRRISMKMSREEKCGFYSGFYFLHGIEVLILVGLLGYFVWNLFYFVAAGFLFHLILDWIDQMLTSGKMSKYFVVWDYFNLRKLKFIGK